MFNNLGQQIYDLCADTLVSMREQQLGILKVADNVIKIVEDQNFDEEQWAIYFMTMRIPHGEQMMRFLEKAMQRFSLVSI